MSELPPTERACILDKYKRVGGFLFKERMMFKDIAYKTKDGAFSVGIHDKKFMLGFWINGSKEFIYIEKELLRDLISEIVSMYIKIKDL